MLVILIVTFMCVLIVFVGLERIYDRQNWSLCLHRQGRELQRVSLVTSGSTLYYLIHKQILNNAVIRLELLILIPAVCIASVMNYQANTDTQSIYYTHLHKQ